MTPDEIIAALEALVGDTDHNGQPDAEGTGRVGDRAEAQRLLTVLLAGPRYSGGSGNRANAKRAHTAYLAELADYSTSRANRFADLDAAVRAAETEIRALAVQSGGHYVDPDVELMDPAVHCASETIAFSRAARIDGVIRRFAKPEAMLRGLTSRPVADAIRRGVKGCAVALEKLQSAPVEDPSVTRVLSRPVRVRSDAAYQAALQEAADFTSYTNLP